MMVAICIPFFGALLGFLGGFAFAPTSYFVSHKSLLPCAIKNWINLIDWIFLPQVSFDSETTSVFLSQIPCVCWLSIAKPKRFSLSWTINWVCYPLVKTVVIIFARLSWIINLVCLFADLHHSRIYLDDYITHWWVEINHSSIERLQVFLIILPTQKEANSLGKPVHCREAGQKANSYNVKVHGSLD